MAAPAAAATASAGAPAAAAAAPAQPKIEKSADGRTKISIEYTADTVCPWCFIGHRRLQKALKAYDAKSYDVQFRYHPYFLAPDMKETVDKLQYYLAKFKVSAEKLQERNEATAKKALEQGDIKLKFGGKVGPTLNSHRLLQWAIPSGKQEKLLGVLNSYYFEQEKDISDLATLAAAAGEAGLDAKEAKTFLDSKTLSDETFKEGKANYDSDDIESVPYITINGLRATAGSQHDFTALLASAVGK